MQSAAQIGYERCKHFLFYELFKICVRCSLVDVVCQPAPASCFAAVTQRAEQRNATQTVRAPRKEAALLSKSRWAQAAGQAGGLVGILKRPQVDRPCCPLGPPFLMFPPWTGPPSEWKRMDYIQAGGFLGLVRWSFQTFVLGRQLGLGSWDSAHVA
jgi:hypothetical protein